MSRSNSTQKQKDRHIRQIHKHHHGKIVLENRLTDVCIWVSRQYGTYNPKLNVIAYESLVSFEISFRE